jgi:hypothetical protein
MSGGGHGPAACPALGSSYPTQATRHHARFERHREAEEKSRQALRGPTTRPGSGVRDREERIAEDDSHRRHCHWKLSRPRPGDATTTICSGARTGNPRRIIGSNREKTAVLTPGPRPAQHRHNRVVAVMSERTNSGCLVAPVIAEGPSDGALQVMDYLIPRRSTGGRAAGITQANSTPNSGCHCGQRRIARRHAIQRQPNRKS